MCTYLVATIYLIYTTDIHFNRNICIIMLQIMLSAHNNAETNQEHQFTSEWGKSVISEFMSVPDRLVSDTDRPADVLGFSHTPVSEDPHCKLWFLSWNWICCTSCCVFWDTFLLTTMIKTVCLSYPNLTFSLNKSGCDLLLTCQPFSAWWPNYCS